MKNDMIAKGALLDEYDLETEYRLRKSEFLIRKIAKTETLPDGWEIQKDSKQNIEL